jgi:UDP-glucose 4-epimerase
MTNPDQGSLWIIGAGGFLGSNLASLSVEAGFTNFPASAISWNDPAQRQKGLEKNASAFAAFARGTQATIIWAAGKGGVATQQREVMSEWSAFSDLVEVLEKTSELFGTQIVICSSAGGVYSGSLSPPFVAINQYGQEKIDIEKIAVARLATKYRILIARLTNLYGPWPGNRQGLVNRLCTAAVTREPIQIYVTLDTSRDYIDVKDAAQILFGEIEFSARQSVSHGVHMCLVGSGRTTSVGEVIATVTNVGRRKIPMSLADLSYKDLQPKDLRVVPTWIERSLLYSPVELPVGTKRLFDVLATSPRWS